VALTAALLAIVELVRRGRIDLPEAGAAAIAVRLLSGQLNTMFTSVGGLLESAPFLADLERFVASAPPPPPPGRKHMLTDRVALHAVSFRYPEQDRPAVDSVDIEIRAGEVVALVGENGSGKTTLAKIVAGLYDPATGTRVWDGAAVPAPDVRASVSVIFQDFVRYQLTLRDNILISDGERAASDDAVTQAALGGWCPRGGTGASRWHRHNAGPGSGRGRGPLRGPVAAWRWQGRCIATPRWSCSTNRRLRSTPGPSTSCSLMSAPCWAAAQRC